MSRNRIVSVEDQLAAGGLTATECAHIVPESTVLNVREGAASEAKARFTCIMSYFVADLLTAQENYTASVLAVLQRFGYDVSALNGERVHSLFNVMTMEKNMHEFFNRLELWFEGTVGTAFMGAAL